jgi:hypothetical protein
MRSTDNPSWATSEDNGNALFKNSEVRAARILRVKFNMSVNELARMYRCCHSTMSYILRGITYADAGGPISAGRKSPSREPGPRSRRYRLGERDSRGKGKVCAVDQDGSQPPSQHQHS